MKKTIAISSFLIFAALSVYSMPLDGNNPYLINRDNMYQFKFSDIKQKISKKKHSSIDKTSETLLINDINFENNKAFSSEDLKKLVNTKIGLKASDENISCIKNTIAHFYQNEGYVAVKIETLKDTGGNLTVKIEEGDNNSIKVEPLDYLLK